MENYITNSAGVGKKILENLNQFSFEHKDSKNNCYFFDWKFNKQFGYITIKLNNNIIAEDSVISTKEDSPYNFKKTLPLYNDPTLKELFIHMLKSIDIYIS